MATHFYSPTTKGFYVEGVHTNLPADAVTITESQYRLLMEGQSLGKEIVYKSRKVQLVDRIGEALSWDQVRARRDNKLKNSDWTQLSDVSMSQEMTTKWLDYRQALRDITETFETPDIIEWPIPPKKAEEE